MSNLYVYFVHCFATIIHFVLPNWLAKEGGWENPNTAREFGNFSEFLVKRYGDRIKFWMTHNEPNIFLGFGYESGIWIFNQKRNGVINRSGFYMFF